MIEVATTLSMVPLSTTIWVGVAAVAVGFIGGFTLAVVLSA